MGTFKVAFGVAVLVLLAAAVTASDIEDTNEASFEAKGRAGPPPPEPVGAPEPPAAEAADEAAGPAPAGTGSEAGAGGDADTESDGAVNERNRFVEDMRKLVLSAPVQYTDLNPSMIDKRVRDDGDLQVRPKHPAMLRRSNSFSEGVYAKSAVARSVATAGFNSALPDTTMRGLVLDSNPLTGEITPNWASSRQYGAQDARMAVENFRQIPKSAVKYDTTPQMVIDSVPSPTSNEVVFAPHAVGPSGADLDAEAWGCAHMTEADMAAGGCDRLAACGRAAPPALRSLCPDLVSADEAAAADNTAGDEADRLGAEEIEAAGGAGAPAVVLPAEADRLEKIEADSENAAEAVGSEEAAPEVNTRPGTEVNSTPEAVAEVNGSEEAGPGSEEVDLSERPRRLRPAFP